MVHLFQKFPSMAKLNIDTSFVVIGVSRAETLTLKAQICVNLYPGERAGGGGYLIVTVTMHD